VESEQGVQRVGHRQQLFGYGIIYAHIINIKARSREYPRYINITFYAHVARVSSVDFRTGSVPGRRPLRGRRFHIHAEADGKIVWLGVSAVQHTVLGNVLENVQFLRGSQGTLQYSLRNTHT